MSTLVLVLALLSTAMADDSRELTGDLEQVQQQASQTRGGRDADSGKGKKVCADASRSSAGVRIDSRRGVQVRVNPRVRVGVGEQTCERIEARKR